MRVICEGIASCREDAKQFTRCSCARPAAEMLVYSQPFQQFNYGRPLMAPSMSSEGMNGDVMPMATTSAAPAPAANGGAHFVYSRRALTASIVEGLKRCRVKRSTPSTEYRETLNEHTGVVESTSIIQPCSSREHDDTDIEEEIVNTFHKKSFIVPSKSQVLFYLSTSRHLRIHHTGCELQVRKHLLHIFVG
ncbi:hypothetical protein OSTOST_07131 [Ostertagia ostertagi]